MNTAVNNIDELLGPDTSAQESTNEVQKEQIVEPVQTEQVPTETVEPVQVENKQTPEQIAENYKRMAHAERMERKAIAEQMKTMQSRFDQLMATIPKQEAQAEPVYEDDPLGATFTKVDKVAQSVAELKAENLQRQQQDQYNGFVNNVKADEANFVQKVPDYRDAVTFIQQRRLQELQIMGYPEEQAMQVLAQDAFALTQRATAMGESPAQFAYNMAKQLGYTAKQASNIEQIAAGQQVAKSVSGGAQPVSEGSLPNNLAEMSDSEFDELFKKMSKS
jgi:hypothetical protein